MKRDILINGISTNNLNNIDIRIRKNSINLILGPSGSGKTSLAYDTVAQIGIHELGAMYSDELNEPNYNVKSYSNIVVTIPIKQINNNNNVRSTVGTYFGLNPCLAKIFSSLLSIPYDFFVLNKSDNVCPECKGLGYTKRLDPVKIIDYNKTLAENPIRCWCKNMDFYRQIILKYCSSRGISDNKRFKQLTQREKNDILYGVGDIKYSIKYKVANHFSTRTTCYYGVMTGQRMLKNFAPSDCFFSEMKCNMCNGAKFEDNHRTYKLCGMSIGDVMLLPLEDIPQWISAIRVKYNCSDINFSLDQLNTFAKKASELNLGHLFINRNIPSLSGGELQRLRLIKVFTSQLSDLLVVLDEPLAGLSRTEKRVVYDNIISLADNHTLLIVDHHDMFIKSASNIYALGKGGGVNGGNLIDESEYLSELSCKQDLKVKPIGKTDKIKILTEIYSFKGIDIRIASNRLNIISGASGIGKSTLIREYLPQYYDSYTYISQKPIRGSSQSEVATVLDVSNLISSFFASHFKRPKSFFSNMARSAGSCRECNGKGTITYGSKLQGQIVLKCENCNGTGFDKKLQKFKINDASLVDVFGMTVDEAVDYFGSIDKKIAKKLHNAQKILLGHLKIGERTSCLSGGENIRIKLIKAIETKNTVIGIDEPFKGLNKKEMFVIIKLLAQLVEDNKTIIVVDHEEFAFQFFSNRIELVNKNGVLCGLCKKGNVIP